ncbi:hypothetical protein HNQ51_003117 [Inhella inkyongensis]|uniref:Uncharacterized protein n=1 Tax=Inhella inkyongensis TaxID=392593 RepID=A0A840SBS0_9BURK|nr:hypothetical protein [Inhella inkyongensis]
MKNDSDRPCLSGQHRWTFTQKIPANDPHPNYWYRCSWCGKEGVQSAPGDSIKAMG